MHHHIKSFLQSHLPDHPCLLLLAFSGGIDSSFLYASLKRYQKEFGYQLHLAHVDHGWRASSAEEAQVLAESVQKDGYPFHLKTLNPETLKGNLEAACREERYTFFGEPSQQYGFHAVLTAHHLDDQVETQLIRCFEGAQLSSLQGIQAVSLQRGIRLWRPLLHCSKVDIALHTQAFVEDPSNKETRFLRARLRENMLPTLTQQFGKNIAAGLQNIAQQARELEEWIHEEVQARKELFIPSPFGDCLNLESCPTLPAMLTKELIKQIFLKRKLPFNQHILTELEALLKEGKANKTKFYHHTHIYIDRHRLFILKRTPALHCVGRVTCTEVQHSQWVDVWKGECYLPVEEGEWVEAKNSLRHVSGKRLDRFWNEKKVPAFLRKALPVLQKQDGRVLDALSGWHPPGSFTSYYKLLMVGR